MKGINLISDLKIGKNEMTGILEEKEVFSIKNDLVNNCYRNNQELILEMNEQGGPKDHNLVEIRFFSHSPQDEDFTQKKTDEILENISTIEKEDHLLCNLPELPFIVPRGKYSADMFLKHLKLHGSSYNYSIAYDNIKKAFLLPLSDGDDIFFVINFEMPLRQGQTIYKYAIINFKTEMEIALQLKADDEIISNLDKNLEKEMEGKYFDVFSKLFKYIVKINITIPGEFKTSKGHNSIKCQYNTRLGELFILKSSFMFVPKPIKHILYKEILRVEFHRTDDSMQNRNIDFELITKFGDKILFNGVEKTESQLLMNHFKKHNIKIELVKEQEEQQDDYEDDLEENSAEEENKNDYNGKYIDEEDESEDEDFNPAKHKNDI